MTASSGPESRRSSAAPDSMSATSANGLTAERSVTAHLRVADGALDLTGRGHLDDVAPVAALDDGAPAYLDQHRRSDVAGVARDAGYGLAGGARRRDAGWSGHAAMVPRRRGRARL